MGKNREYQGGKNLFLYIKGGFGIRESECLWNPLEFHGKPVHRKSFQIYLNASFLCSRVLNAFGHRLNVCFVVTVRALFHFLEPRADTEFCSPATSMHIDIHSQGFLVTCHT